MKETWLIAVDLDGTLFNEERHVSPRTLEVMQGVVELGHSLVVVTGRSSHSALPKLHSIPDGIRLICANGAYEYDRNQQAIVWANPMSSSVAAEIRQRILGEVPSTSFGWESVNGLNYESTFIAEAGGAHTLEQGGLKEPLSKNDILKMYVRAPGLNSADLAVALRKIVEDEVEVSSSGAPFAEITAPGVDKGSALARVAFDMGFNPERVMAFGDSLNDVPMLTWAGQAIAMGNANSEIKSIATAHAGANSEDGVATMLEAIFADAFP